MSLSSSTPSGFEPAKQYHSGFGMEAACLSASHSVNFSFAKLNLVKRPRRRVNSTPVGFEQAGSLESLQSHQQPYWQEQPWGTPY